MHSAIGGSIAGVNEDLPAGKIRMRPMERNDKPDDRLRG
jgi:hypothetical protein